MVLRPQRHPADDTSDFEDPLSRYEAPVYNDEFERALCEDRITEMKVTPFSTISPSTSIVEAMSIMLGNDVACLMVVENDHLVGIFTERDVLNKVAERFDQIKHLPVSLVMTHEPAVVYDNSAPAMALNLMAVAGFRHVPILNMSGQIVGIVGPRRAVAYLRKFLM